MKGKLSNRLLTIAAAGLLAAVTVLPGIGTLKARAAVDNYTPVTGTADTTFTKYLVIPKDATVPNLTFNFTIEAGAAVAGDSTHMAVYAGNDTTKVTGTPVLTAYADSAITSNQVEFTTGDATTDGQADDGIANSEEKKYASKKVKIDFSGVSFKEPGVYRYLIKEDITSLSGVTPDSELVRTLDVNVIDVNGALAIDTYVMYYGTLTDAQPKADADVKKETDKKNSKKTGITTGDKCDNYVNEWPSQNLYIGKKIDGNQASKDKYFRFTINITDAGNGSIITLDGNYDSSVAYNVNGATTIANADKEEGKNAFDNPSGKNANAKTITVGTDGSKTIVVYLQGDQYIQLMGLKKGAHYEVTEDDYEPDGYVSTATSSTNTFTIGTGTDAKTFNAVTSGVIDDADVLTGYKNVKQGVIPTGVILSVAPWVIAGIVIIAGVVFFAIRSRKKYEE